MKRVTTPVDEDYVLLHFTDGLCIDPRVCELRIHTRSHWNRDGSCRCQDAA